MSLAGTNNPQNYGGAILFHSPTTYGGVGAAVVADEVSEQMALRLRKPNAKNVVLALMRVGQWAKRVVYGGVTPGLWGFVVPQIVSRVQVNGGGFLTRVAQADVPTTPNSFFAALTYGAFDIEGGIGYALDVNIPAPFSPETHTLVAYRDFRLSTIAKEIDGFFWEPMIVDVPRLSLRIESRFGGVGQLGGGRISLNNGSGFWDRVDGLDWDAATIDLYLGLDMPNEADMAFADYKRVGTWKCHVTERNNQTLNLTLVELKTRLDRKIPFDTFTQAAFPLLDQSTIGKVIPFAWGKNYGVKPLVIDPANKRFKVAGHRIRSFDDIRIKAADSNGWLSIGFVSTDLEHAEFTLGSEWTPGVEVSVDFKGRTNPDGRLMSNASDVILDILKLIGETEVDQTTFGLSRRLLKIGTDRFGDDVSVLPPAIYLDSATSALDVVGEINRTVGSSLYVDFEGRWRYVVFNPTPEAQLRSSTNRTPRTFSSEEILDGSFTKSVDRARVFSKVRVLFAERKQEEFTEAVVQENSVTRVRHLINSTLVEERKIGLSTRKDALYYAQRLLSTEALPITTFKFDLPRNGFFLLPGQIIRFKRQRREGFDALLEVLGVDMDFTANRVTVTAGDQRGFGDTFGFWAEDIGTPAPTPAIPDDVTWWLRNISLGEYVNGQRIPSWRDSGLHNTSAVQGVISLMPILRTNALNGRPVARFGSGSRNFLLSNLSQAIGWPEAEVFVLAKATAAVAGNNTLWNMGSSVTVQKWPSAANDIIEEFATTSSKTWANGVALNQWRVYNVASAAGSYNAWIDGLSVFTTATNTVGLIPFQGNYQFFLGGHDTSAGHFDGEIAEVLVFNRQLTQPERDGVVAYLSDIAGLDLGGGGSTPPAPWDPDWTRDEVAVRRNNAGFWSTLRFPAIPHNTITNPEIDQARMEDARSFLAGRWW